MIMLSVSSELEMGRGQAGFGEDVGDSFDEVGLAQLARRKVHRHHQIGASGVDPAPGLAADSSNTHSPSDIRLVSSASGMKRIGAIMPCTGSFQRTAIRSRSPVPAEVELGLEMKHELTLHDRPSQRGFERQPLVGGAGECRHQKLKVLRPDSFGLVDRDVGMLDQFGAAAAVVRIGSRCRHSHPQTWCRWATRRSLEHREELARNVGGIIAALQILEDQQKLVATEASEGVLVADAFGRRCANASSSSSPTGCPEVVDVLELVEVDMEHRRGACADRRSRGRG